MATNTELDLKPYYLYALADRDEFLYDMGIGPDPYAEDDEWNLET